jgi:hypothetical protein
MLVVEQFPLSSLGTRVRYLRNVFRFPPFPPCPALTEVLKLLLVDSWSGLGRVKMV